MMSISRGSGGRVVAANGYDLLLQVKRTREADASMPSERSIGFVSIIQADCLRPLGR